MKKHSINGQLYKFKNARKFFFHYNKPQSLRDKSTKISVHFANACHIVDNIVCYVHTNGKVRNSGSPKFVMEGYSDIFFIKDGIIYIGNSTL